MSDSRTVQISGKGEDPSCEGASQSEGVGPEADGGGDGAERVFARAEQGAPTDVLHESFPPGEGVPSPRPPRLPEAPQTAQDTVRLSYG